MADNQSIQLDGILSQPFPANDGVPRGFLLAPTVFHLLTSSTSAHPIQFTLLSIVSSSIVPLRAALFPVQMPTLIETVMSSMYGSIAVLNEYSRYLDHMPRFPSMLSTEDITL